MVPDSLGIAGVGGISNKGGFECVRNPKNLHIPSNAFSHQFLFAHRNKTLERKIKRFKDSRRKRRSFARQISTRKMPQGEFGLQTDCKHTEEKVKIVRASQINARPMGKGKDRSHLLKLSGLIQSFL
ncbi:hypothetical protein CEXT_578111 [Caerostris extrusa]|uniref:Uncharacterized protein n=1 Tax=Caerostris extrusa TaxID=172846 RepID=A0AAV4Y6N5_CAEEX|nr:hypothetical protein CEXT_578111 [Caerostris extrusa]